MLFLFRGQYRHVARAVIGAIFIALGLVLHNGALLIGIGAVMLVWAGIGAYRAQRSRQHIGSGRRMS
jgi:hypothetical protein